MVAIPGTKRIRYVDENVAAAAVELTGEERAFLDGCSPETAWAGQRSSGKLTQGLATAPNCPYAPAGGGPFMLVLDEAEYRETAGH